MDMHHLARPPLPRAPDYPPPPVPQPPATPPLLAVPRPPTSLPPATPPPPPSSSTPTSVATSSSQSDPVEVMRKLLLDSERNLKMHKEKLTEQQNVQVLEAIRNSENEILNKMFVECGLHLDELSKLLLPMDKDRCPILALNEARDWILSRCVTIKSIETVFRFFTAMIKDGTTTARLKLHILYLVNDMCTTWIRKKSIPFLTMVKQFLPLMYACGYCQIKDDQMKSKFSRLKNIWHENKVIEDAELEKINNIDATLQAHFEVQKELFQSSIAKVVEKFHLQYRQIEAQHDAYARYLTDQINLLQKTKHTPPPPQPTPTPSPQRPAEMAGNFSPMAPPMETYPNDGYLMQPHSAPYGGRPFPSRYPPFVGMPPPGMQCRMPPAAAAHPSAGGPRMMPMRNGRFEAHFFPPFGGAGPRGRLGGPYGVGGRNGNAFRPWPRNDMVRMAPCPAAGPQPLMAPRWNYDGPAYASGPMVAPPQPLMSMGAGSVRFPVPSGFRPPFEASMPGIAGMEKLNRPYYEQPAGMMMASVRLEDDDYKSLNPKKLRLPRLLPTHEQLINAVDAFYRRPNHENPRDSAGWERLGMYEYFRAKRNAMRHKKEQRQERGYDSRSPDSSLSPSDDERAAQ